MTASMLPLVAAAGNGRALWYLTRATGLVALVALTATLVMGVVASVGWTTKRWPRFLSQAVHRNLSLFCVGLVAVHVVTTVSDGYVPIGLTDAFVPFVSPYRPVWIGLGALCFDLLLVVMVTSALRHRIGFTSWRYIHWTAYACWPIAMFHSLGSGSDARLPFALAVDALCASALVVAVAWRLATGRSFRVGPRVVAAVGTVVVVVGLIAFAAAGPLRPGWSRRAGTSTALLDKLAQSATAGSTGARSSPSSRSTGTTSATAGVPSAPFTYDLTGTQTTAATGRGTTQVTLSMTLNDPASTPLTVHLIGAPDRQGGIVMSSGSVAFGPYHGTVSELSGDTVAVVVQAPAPEQLTLSLQVDADTGPVSGTVTGTGR